MAIETNPAEIIKRAINQTTRAMADDHDIELQFTTETPYEAGTVKRIPTLSRKIETSEILRARGSGDMFAFYRKHHDERVSAKYQFSDNEASEIFNAMERARCELRGGQDLPGALSNIDFEREDAYASKETPTRENTSIAEAAALWLRKNASEKSLGAGAKERLDLFDEKLAALTPALENLTQNLNDQSKFADALQNALKDMGYDLPDVDGDNEMPEDDNAQQDEEDDVESTGEDDSDSEDEPEATESSDDESDADSEASISEDETSDAEGEAQDSDPGEPNEYALPMSEADPNYTVYTNKYDQSIAAEELAEPEELERLRGFLDRQIEPIKSGIARLAHRLQRRLMAKQNRSWLFDQEEGILDAARLARVVSNPTTPLSFKIEKDIVFRDTIVTLLIDNSGSMRGRPISIAAICADILAQTLERCQVKCEVLGFTTIAWKGGQSRADWLEAGREANPGRLNDLRHIIYKAADAPWRRARNNLGLMMKEGLLKENIDGEALEWAHARMTVRPEQRRILMVVSDGAPVDDSTLSVNSSNFLDAHLRKVIEMIETQKRVELVAIGIGHDVTRYYKRAVTITDPEQLAGAVTEQLAALFDESPKGNR